MATPHVVRDRQSPRDKVIMPITLVANPAGQRALVPASVLDFSVDGLRIQTSVRLSIGELIHVQFAEDPAGPRLYEVVWTKPAGALRPGQAGLRSRESGPKAMPGRIKKLVTIEPLASAA
jgi:hypothetical protein